MQLTARERLARFRTLRTEAGFLMPGLAGVSPEDRPARVREVVDEVFALFGADPETGPLPAPDPAALSAEEQREVLLWESARRCSPEPFYRLFGRWWVRGPFTVRLS